MTRSQLHIHYIFLFIFPDLLCYKRHLRVESWKKISLSFVCAVSVLFGINCICLQAKSYFNIISFFFFNKKLDWPLQPRDLYKNASGVSVAENAQS